MSLEETIRARVEKNVQELFGIKRKDDGTFAPKGQGKVLSPRQERKAAKRAAKQARKDEKRAAKQAKKMDKGSAAKRKAEIDKKEQQYDQAKGEKRMSFGKYLIADGLGRGAASIAGAAVMGGGYLALGAAGIAVTPIIAGGLLVAGLGAFLGAWRKVDKWAAKKWGTPRPKRKGEAVEAAPQEKTFSAKNIPVIRKKFLAAYATAKPEDRDKLVKAALAIQRSLVDLQVQGGGEEPAPEE